MTGRTGCPATAPWPCPATASRRSRRTRARTRARRDGSGAFHCRNIRKPDSLVAIWERYQRSGTIVAVPTELFREHSWFAVFTGQEVIPRTWHPFADIPDDAELERRLKLISSDIRKVVDNFLPHDEYLRR